MLKSETHTIKLKDEVGVFSVIKKNISEVLSLTTVLKTSFGPLGMDKVIKESPGNIIITNDGATILSCAHTMMTIITMMEGGSSTPTFTCPCVVK